ncbi:MAG: MoaD/ThiS family protein [Bacteroidetes bacterium]|nr:MoaD/ThiS family protein [Bacteroidota bacterium]
MARKLRAGEDKMTIHVYAKLKDYFEPEFELEETIGNTDQLQEALVRINGGASELLSTCRFAVREGFIDNTFKLEEHDIVVIIPPSSGG